ncbi:aminotransferase class V-fold PLP-dependent enzyme [Rarobacter faecitabidus]|uniref:Selenocysteine lyase/cysteine desulfurase n=1 Tax=Rarobacter faecitabidus TaxID=13243 RepID=A0A542ZUI2_RARFA|nr:aminotransferase class V-fold PLP-dependent enzyme [Rarobacter faecitabidus]TQL64018.1 selenocysteine lyase/cysteine desulfurase [Rarobacter faecitabidus]
MTATTSTPECTERGDGLHTARLADRAPLAPLIGAATQVPLADGSHTRYVNLDIAASAPALESVAGRVAEVLPWYSSVHRGAGYLSRVSTSLYEDSRQRIGAFFGATRADETIIVRNTTDATNLLAASVPGNVLVLDVEHHANLLPWRRTNHTVRTIPAPTTIAETLETLRTELARSPYALLAITGASNVTGEALPLAQVADIAHEGGARLFVDAAQLAPHRRFSISELGIDYIAISGHKLYAPYGAGALIGKSDWLDAAPAFLAGGGAVGHVGIDDVVWQTGPARHEGGSPNVIGAVALAAACDALDGIGAAALDQHDRELRGRLLRGLAQIPGVRTARIWADSDEAIGVATFTVDGVEPGLLAMQLSAEFGIGVRDGKFCAHPLLRRLGFSGGAVRASIGVGSSSADVDTLLTALRQLVANGPGFEYETLDGGWVLANDPRPLPLGLGALVPTAASQCGILAP